MFNTRHSIHCTKLNLFISAFLFLHSTYATCAEKQETPTEQLESVQNRIQDIQSTMDEARDKIAALQAELKTNETSASSITLNLREIKSQLSQREKKLEALKLKQSEHEEALGKEKEALASQIRTAYMVGRNDYLKLLLNQEDPAKVGRVLAYYDYHNQARAEKINLVKNKIQTLSELESSIIREKNALLKLEKKQLAENKAISNSRGEREKILNALLDEFVNQGLELEGLKQQEEETKKLIKKLVKTQSKKAQDRKNKAKETQGSVAIFEDTPPFNTLKGKLDWPVTGKLFTRFGSRKQGGTLTWQGVIIDAETGADVHAVSSGQVVFADWFRNLGLLIIIDHGDGFMSLYGYNQSLLKKVGDWILPGEVIAYAGDSGGQSRSGVYFEIRDNGNPVNPAKWCKK